MTTDVRSPDAVTASGDGDDQGVRRARRTSCHGPSHDSHAAIATVVVLACYAMVMLVAGGHPYPVVEAGRDVSIGRGLWMLVLEAVVAGLGTLATARLLPGSATHRALALLGAQVVPCLVVIMPVALVMEGHVFHVVHEGVMLIALVLAVRALGRGCAPAR